MLTWAVPTRTAVLVLADGTVLWGRGFGATGWRIGELCFNTAMTGYQEVLTDPSYASQIVVFTFPHIGNTGTTDVDSEMQGMMSKPSAAGVVLREDITPPSSHRSTMHFADWLRERDIIAISGIDTRSLTTKIRMEGAIVAAMMHTPDGQCDPGMLRERIADWPGLDDLLSPIAPYEWQDPSRNLPSADNRHHIVVVDCGVKSSILRHLGHLGCRITVVPATISIEDINRCRADGYVVSNGPGDPAAMHDILPLVRHLVATGKPTFGICLGHQLLALALGGHTVKMHQGHHGTNHPVKDLDSGRIDIVSMNHGFTVDRDRLPPNLKETHVSLFDGTNCGLRCTDAPALSVQHHPEASPGPHDAAHLFRRFINLIQEQKNLPPYPERPDIPIQLDAGSPGKE